MVGTKPQEDKRSEIKKAADDVKEEFRKITSNLSFDSVRSMINPRGTAYFDYLHIISGSKTAKEVAEEVKLEAKKLGIL